MMTMQLPLSVHLLVMLSIHVAVSFSPAEANERSTLGDPAGSLLVVTDSSARDAGVAEEALISGRERLLSAGVTRASRIAASLDSNTRTRDVFGGRIKAEPVSTGSPEPDATNQRRVAATAAIESLIVAGVAPQRAEAYVENWILRPGDGVQIVHGGNTFLFTVDSVDGESIAFVEAEDGFRVMARLQVIPDSTPTEMSALRPRSP